MRITKGMSMEGIDAARSRVVGNNTFEYHKANGTRVIRLHYTDILEFPSRGGVIFNSGGWRTITTRSRMNKHQTFAHVIQDKSLWYISKSANPWTEKDTWTPFFDGIKVKGGRVVNPKKDAHKRDKRLLKQISAYCKALQELPKLPEPDGGDCWSCNMRTGEGQVLGNFIDSDHLQMHLDEVYIHGSLIFNALQWAGYPHPEFIFQRDLRVFIVPAVRRYFKAQLGLVY